MEKNNITKIIRMFLSARFPSETEEKVQKWILKDKDTEAKKNASLEYWNELEAEAGPGTYAALERVNLRTGHNKEHLDNIVAYQRFSRVAAVLIPLFLLTGGLFYYFTFDNSGSIIRYPETFAKDKRLVTLNGEAYFSVKRKRQNLLSLRPPGFL